MERVRPSEALRVPRPHTRSPRPGAVAPVTSSTEWNIPEFSGACVRARVQERAGEGGRRREGEEEGGGGREEGEGEGGERWSPYVLTPVLSHALPPFVCVFRFMYLSV